MVRETRYLLVGNLPEKTPEDAVAEHFKRYGKIQSVKIHHKENEEGSSAIVAFGDIKSASKAHGTENRIEGNLLSTEYCEGSATGSAVTRTVEPRLGSYNRSFSRSKGSEDNESFESYYGNSRYSGNYGDEMYSRGRPRERFSGRGTFKSYDNRGGFHGRPKIVDQSSQDEFEKPKPPHSPAHSTSHSGSRHSSKNKKEKRVSRSGSHTSSSSSSSGSSSSCGSRSSSGSSSPGSNARSHALPTTTSLVKSYRTESQESINSDKTGANDDDKRPRGICINHLPIRSTDTSLRDGLFHEYKKYGKVNAVLVAGVGEERYAIVSFRKPEDAAKAMSASQDKIFFGSKIKVSQHEGIEVDDNEFRPPEAELDEHHPKATRTLFVGNLEKDISNQELRERFLKFGDILDIDVKRQGAVSAYAFVQFTDIRSVVKVLKEMEGEVWGSMKLKLGFGKSMPTNCVWLDNVDQTVQENFLSRQFGRYGQVTHGIIDRIKGKALVYFTNAEQAQYALVEMRNRILNNKKIMIDFASRDCQVEFYEQMEKNGQLKPGLRPDERRGWLYNRQTPEGQWEASYDNRSGNFVKFTSPGFRGPQRSSRVAGRGASRYKEEFPDEFKRTRSYEDYRYPGESDDFEQDLRAYQRERQHGSQSPPPYGEDVYSDPAYQRSKDFYKYAESYRSASPHSERTYEGFEYDKIRGEEKYYGKERYVVRERSPEVQYNRSWSRSPSHGGQISATKEAVGRNTPPTPMDDEARDFSRDVSPVEEGQSKFGDSKNKRRSEDDFNICEADIAELSSRSKFTGVFHKEPYERKRSYEESFNQEYMKSPRKHNRQLMSKSSVDRIESSKRDLYQKYQIIQSRITEKLKGRNESSPSSASSGSEPGQVTEGGELSNLQHEKALLLEKLKQLDKESSTSDIEEAFDIEDPRKIPPKRARLEPMGAWGDSHHQLQTGLGSVTNKYDYRGIDSTSSVRKDSIHSFEEKERNKSCTRSSVEGSDHEDFTSLVSPKEVHIGFIKKRKKSEHSEENNRSYRSKHGEEEAHAGSDTDEFRNVSRMDQLSSNPVFRRLSSTDSSSRTYYPHESYSEVHRPNETDMSGGDGLSMSHSEESKQHKRSDSTNKSHSHRSKHRHKEEHQPTKIPLEEDFSNSENLDPRNPHRIRQSVSLPLPKFAKLDANVMTSPDVNESPINSKAESPRFSSPSSGSKNTSSPQRSPSESNSTNSQENPHQEYIPEENPSDLNNDAAPMESMGEKGEFDSDGSSEHSDHNDSFELDKISLEERIRRLDEKLNAVPVPQSSTKLTSEISSLPTNSTVVAKSDPLMSSLSRTALYSKYKINKKEVTPGAGTEVKPGENTEVTRKVTSRFSIIDQDTKRLQDKIQENFSPKSTPHFDETHISPMTPLRTKGAVKEMPAQMPHLATLPGSLAGRLGNGAAPFPTLTVTTSSSSSRPDEAITVDVYSASPAVVPVMNDRQWQVESNSLKTPVKSWQMDSISLSKNSSPDHISKDMASGHVSEETSYKPLITPAFKKQMSDNFPRTDEKSSPKNSPLELNKSLSPSLENKRQSPVSNVLCPSPKSEVKLQDAGGQKSNLDIAQSDNSQISKMEKECSMEESKSSDLSKELKMDLSKEDEFSKTDKGFLDDSTEMECEESESSAGKLNHDTQETSKPKNLSPVVLTKAEVKDMSPVSLHPSGSKDKSVKESPKKLNSESAEDITGVNSTVVVGKRKAETDEASKLENEKNKDSVTEPKSLNNSSDSESLDLEKTTQAKKPKIHKTESHNSELSEKLEKSSSSSKGKDSQKKDKNKDSKKKEKCEGDSTKKDKNHHERKDKDKDGGRDKGTSSSSTRLLSSSNTSKTESEKNSKTEDKKAKSSKSEEKKTEKSSKVVGSSKSSDDKTKSSELNDKNSKSTNEKKPSSSENKKDAEKVKKSSDPSAHRKDSKSSSSMKPPSEKSKEKSKDRSNVKSRDSSKSDKSTKDGTNDKHCNKTKTDAKSTEKITKSENSNTEKSKDFSEEKQKNAFTSESNAKAGKSTDAENKGNSSHNSENSERNGEKPTNPDTGSCPNAPSDQCKDNKPKGKHSTNEKSGKPKHRDETRVKAKEKHSTSEKSKDKVSKEGKSSSKKEETKAENGKDNIERKIEPKTEQTDSKAKQTEPNEKSEDKKSENSDRKMSSKDSHSDSKKKSHESSKPSDKMHKSHKLKSSSSSSVSEDVTTSDTSKNSKSAEKSKIPKTEHRSKNDNDKTVKKEIKVSKSEDDKKKPSKSTSEKKKSSKENKPIKSVTPKKKDKKEEKIEEHKSAEVAKKVVADDDFDWDAWQDASMYDKVKRRSTIKDKERELEQNRQKQLDRLQERRQKKSKSSVLQSDISSTNYSDSDDVEQSKKPFNKRKSKSKKIYSSSDTDSDFRSSIFPAEKKLQPQKPKFDPSKKSKKASIFNNIYSSDSDESTDSSFTVSPETKKKTKHVKKVSSFESDDVFSSKSKKTSKKDQDNFKTRVSAKSGSVKKQNIFSMLSSSSDISDDSDSDLDFNKFNRSKENNMKPFDKKSVTQKSSGRIYSSSDSDSAEEESNIIPVPKPISVSSKASKNKTKEKQRSLEDNLKKMGVSENKFIEEKTASTVDKETYKSPVISHTALDKEVCVESVLEAVEKTEKNRKDKMKKKNKKKEKENILVGEGKLEIGKNHNYGLFEKIETLMAQSNSKGKKASLDQKAAPEDSKNMLKDVPEHVEKPKESKKKKSDSVKEREQIKKQMFISPIMSPVSEFSDSINIDSVKHEEGSVIVDEIPLDENSLLMDQPCGAGSDNARSMWDVSEVREKMSSVSPVIDEQEKSPDKTSTDNEDSKDPKVKKTKKKKVDKDSDASTKSKKSVKSDKDSGKEKKKKKNKGKTCSEVDKTIDDVSKGRDILLSENGERADSHGKKIDSTATDFSDVDLDFSTPLFGNFVPEKIKPNRPSAKDKSENEETEGEVSEDKRKYDDLFDMPLADDLMDTGRQGLENVEESANVESKLSEVKPQSSDQKMLECSDATLFKNPESSSKNAKGSSNAESSSKNAKSSSKSEGKELNDVKLPNHASKEGKDSITPANSVKAMFGKGSDSANQKKTADVFDFREDEEEVLDKLKPRHSTEKESSQKSKKASDSSKTSFKWDINDITSKDTKPSFEPKMTNKMVNHKQESLFASWAKSLAEKNDKDQNTNTSSESIVNKLNKKSNAIKKQPKVSVTSEGKDADHDLQSKSVAQTGHDDGFVAPVEEKTNETKKLVVEESQKGTKTNDKKLDEVNIKIAETIEAVSTIQDLQNEEKRERESDMFGDEGTLVIDETNPCVPEAIPEHPAEQEAPQADSETALAIQSILGLEVEDATSKLQEYTEPEVSVEPSMPDNPPTEGKIVSEDLIEETRVAESLIPSAVVPEPVQSQLPPLNVNFSPEPIQQGPVANVMPSKEQVDTISPQKFDDHRQRGKRQKPLKTAPPQPAPIVYPNAVSEDCLQDTRNKEDSDDGALHIADIPPISPREAQASVIHQTHQALETREELAAPEFEVPVPSVKKTKARRRTSGKSTEELNFMPMVEHNQPSAVDLPLCAPTTRPEPEPELETRVEIPGLASPPLMISNKGEDKDISMSDYTDSERNDDSELGGEETKRPQRGGCRRKNYKKMSGISPRTNSPRSRTSPRSPRVASPKQLSPKSDIAASPVVKIERLPLANKTFKAEEEQPPKDIQPTPAPSTAVKENVSLKDIRHGKPMTTAVEMAPKALNVYDFDDVESEEQNAPILKRRSSSRKKKSTEETFESKDTGKVLKSEIMDTGIKMTIRPTVRQSKEAVKEKGNDFPRLNEIPMGHPDPVPRDVVHPALPVEEKKAIKPRDIMSAEYRTRASSIPSAKENSKVPTASEQSLMGTPQPAMPQMSNVDRIIDDVSKGYFDTPDKGQLNLPQPANNNFTTPLTVEVSAYERKRTSSRGSCAEESLLKSPSMKSPSLKSPQMSAANPAFQLPTCLVKTPANTISPVNAMYQGPRISAIMSNAAYPGYLADLQNRDVMSHLMPATPTVSSSPISTQSSVIGTMASKLDVHVTMTLPQLANNNGGLPAHMSSAHGNNVVAEKEMGMNLTKSANESFPTTVLNTVSSTSIGKSVIASAHSHLVQSANKHLANVEMSTRRTEASNSAKKQNMSIVSATKMQNISSQLPTRNAEKSNVPSAGASGERQQQSVSAAPTCVVHPITTTSLSRQPHNMPAMIQPPTGGDPFFSEHKIREDMTKEKLQHLQYMQLMQDLNQQQIAKMSKAVQKQEMSKENTQRPPSAHSNQHKQSLPGEAHIRLAQEQAFLSMQQEFQSNVQLLHSKQGFYPPSFWAHHPHLQPVGVKIDDKKAEVKTTSPSLNHQQYNILDASSQHPQIKSPALAQTAPNIHQMGHQLSNNTSPPNSANKKILEKSNTTMRWGNELVMSAHEGPKSQLPSHEAPRASPREHWAQPSNMHPQPGPKPAHQQSEVNPPMSQKEHIKKKRAEERKQQELEELHYQRQRELHFKQLQMEQAAHRKASGSTSNQPTDMRQTAHVPGQQRPDGQLDNKNLMDPHFQHPMYPGIPDMRRPPSQNQSAFTPPISGTDISQAIPAHKNYAEIQQQYQQHPHLYMERLFSSRLPPHYLTQPGLPIQDLTDSGPAGRSRSPHVQNPPVPAQTSKHREQGEQLSRSIHDNPMNMPPRAIQEAPAPPGGEGSLLSLLQRYPVMWQGVLALKNDQCVVQLHMINGFEQLVKLSLPQQGPDGSVQPLRIAQRMRLEAAQLDGVIKRMKFDNDYCMLLALPCGRDHDHIIEQTRAMTTGFIQYLQQKQAAGIVNVAEPETQQPAYVVHIFPPCDFSRSTLERLGFGLMQPLRDLAHLLVIITTVA